MTSAAYPAAYCVYFFFSSTLHFSTQTGKILVYKVASLFRDYFAYYMYARNLTTDLNVSFLSLY